MTTAAAGSFVVIGVAVGTAIVGGGLYLLSSSASSDLGAKIMILGIGVGTSIIDFGVRSYKENQKKIDQDKRNFQDMSRFYRFVRLIPDEFYLFTDTKPHLVLSDENLQVREEFYLPNFGVLPFISTKSHKFGSDLATKIELYFKGE
jgi:hypothetical protein